MENKGNDKENGTGLIPGALVIDDLAGWSELDRASDDELKSNIWIACKCLLPAHIFYKITQDNVEAAVKEIRKKSKHRMIPVGSEQEK